MKPVASQVTGCSKIVSVCIFQCCHIFYALCPIICPIFFHPISIIVRISTNMCFSNHSYSLLHCYIYSYMHVFFFVFHSVGLAFQLFTWVRILTPPTNTFSCTSCRSAFTPPLNVTHIYLFLPHLLKYVNFLVICKAHCQALHPYQSSVAYESVIKFQLRSAVKKKIKCRGPVTWSSVSEGVLLMYILTFNVSHFDSEACKALLLKIRVIDFGFWIMACVSVSQFFSASVSLEENGKRRLLGLCEP